jgi:hypothetical protein
MRYLLIAHVTCVIAGTSAAAQGETALREWLICGAFPGLAGVSVLGVDAEAHLRPAEGDVVALTIPLRPNGAALSRRRTESISKATGPSGSTRTSPTPAGAPTPVST